MTIDLDKIEALAKAATPGPWRGDRFDGTVKYDIVAGDYPNGQYTTVIRGDSEGLFGFFKSEDSDFVMAANPSTILALVAEVRRLREALSTPLLTGADAPMYGGIFGAEGANRDVAETAFCSGAPTVTVYYGEKRVYTSMAEFCAVHPGEKS